MNKRIKVILLSSVLIGVLAVLCWAVFHLPESPYDYELSSELVEDHQVLHSADKLSSIHIYRSVYENNWPWLAPEELEELPVVYKTSDENEIREFMSTMRESSRVIFDTAGKKKELLYVLITMKDGRKAFYSIIPYRELGMIAIGVFPRPDEWIGYEGSLSVEFYKFLMQPGRLG